MTTRKLRAWDPTAQPRRKKRAYEKAQTALRTWLNKARAKHGLPAKEYTEDELARFLWALDSKRTEHEHRFHEMDTVAGAPAGMGDWAQGAEIDPARAIEKASQASAAWIKRATDFSADLTPLEYKVHVLSLLAWWFDAHPDEVFLPTATVATLSFPPDWAARDLDQQVSFMCWLRLICTGYHELLGLPPDDKSAIGFRLHLWAAFLSTTVQAVKDAQGRVRAKGIAYSLPDVF